MAPLKSPFFVTCSIQKVLPRLCRMETGLFIIFLSFMTIVQCDRVALLREIRLFDFTQIFDRISTTNIDDIKNVIHSQDISDDDIFRSRNYDLDKCVIELGGIADGLNRAEMWALKCNPLDLKLCLIYDNWNKFFLNFDFVAEIVVDSWGKVPSGILEGNVYSLGSFLECLNIERNGKMYKSQYCLAQITPKSETGQFQRKPIDRLSEIGFLPK